MTVVMNAGTMKAFRRALTVDHDTDIHVIAGDEAPNYFSLGTWDASRGAAMKVGIKWLEQNYPDCFAEVISVRIRLRKP